MSLKCSKGGEIRDEIEFIVFSTSFDSLRINIFVFSLKSVWKSRQEEEEEKQKWIAERQRQLDHHPSSSGVFNPQFPEKWVKMRNPERHQPLMFMTPPPGSRNRNRLWEYNPNDYAANYEILRLNLKPCWPQFLLWELEEGETERIAAEKRGEVVSHAAAIVAESSIGNSRKRKRVEEQFDLADLPVEASLAVLAQKNKAADASRSKRGATDSSLPYDDFEIAKLDNDSDFTSDRGEGSSDSSDEEDAGAESITDLSALLAPDTTPENDPVRKEFTKEKQKVLGLISAMFPESDEESVAPPPTKKVRYSSSSSSAPPSSSSSSSSSSSESDDEEAISESPSSPSSSDAQKAVPSPLASSKSSSASLPSSSESSESDEEAEAAPTAVPEEPMNVDQPHDSVQQADEVKVPEFQIAREDIGGMFAPLRPLFRSSSFFFIRRCGRLFVRYDCR